MTRTETLPVKDKVTGLLVESATGIPICVLSLIKVMVRFPESLVIYSKSAIKPESNNPAFRTWQQTVDYGSRNLHGGVNRFRITFFFRGNVLDLDWYHIGSDPEKTKMEMEKEFEKGMVYRLRLESMTLPKL